LRLFFGIVCVVLAALFIVAALIALTPDALASGSAIFVVFALLFAAGLLFAAVRLIRHRPEASPADPPTGGD